MTLDGLLNVGPVSARMLVDVGIETAADLKRAGAVLAYRAVRDRHPRAGLNLLYALHGALIGERWDRLSAETKARLQAEAADAASVPADVRRGP